MTEQRKATLNAALERFGYEIPLCSTCPTRDECLAAAREMQKTAPYLSGHCERVIVSFLNRGSLDGVRWVLHYLETGEKGWHGAGGSG